MNLKNENSTLLLQPAEVSRSSRERRTKHVTRPIAAADPMPPGLCLSERAVALLRAYLDDHGMADYRVYHCTSHDLSDIDRYLDDLGETGTPWLPIAPLAREGQTMTELTRPDRAAQRDGEGPRAWPSDILRLRHFPVVIARWYWVQPGGSDDFCDFWLIAMASPDAYMKLRRELLRLRRARTKARWEIIKRGIYSSERLRFDPGESPDLDDLIIPPAIRQRIDTDILQFFSEAARDLYASLRVPYRRGVLLYGPPGNGKTSIIRVLGPALPRVSGLILSPTSNIDNNGFDWLVQRWSEMAPAVLVIEDLDHLLKKVNVSTFLNLIDGMDSPPSGGMLLIATTNHPDQLDPAINNRPGRFDVTIEFPNPDATQRLEFLRKKLAPQIADDVLTRCAELTERLSFAHLQEVLRLSGLLAIQASRRERTGDDVIRATESVRESSEEAARGFPGKPEMPFGLGHLHALRKERR